MTEELMRFNELLEGISITDELPDNILELKLTDLLCKHVFNSSDKAFKLLMASIRVGYDYCQWNVANNHFKDFDYDMQRILKMEKDNYNHALRIVACKYSFSENIFYWCDNMHSAIKYIRQYGKDVRLKDLPFYVVTSGYNTKIITYNNSVRLKVKDVEGIFISATQRFRWSNSKDILDVYYTIGDFIKDNPEFIEYDERPTILAASGDYIGTISIADTKNKVIFWDIDGVLAPYRFNGHVGDPDGTNNGMSITEINNGCFLNRKPLKLMQNVINTCASKQNIIMWHYQIQKEKDDKEIWLDKYYPCITERLFVFEDMPKWQAIINYCNSHNISLDNIIFVDDTLSILREAERHGIESWHISSFMDWNLCMDWNL